MPSHHIPESHPHVSFDQGLYERIEACARGVRAFQNEQNCYQEFSTKASGRDHKALMDRLSELETEILNVQRGMVDLAYNIEKEFKNISTQMTIHADVSNTRFAELAQQFDRKMDALYISRDVELHDIFSISIRSFLTSHEKLVDGKMEAMILALKAKHELELVTNRPWWKRMF